MTDLDAAVTAHALESLAVECAAAVRYMTLLASSADPAATVEAGAILVAEIGRQGESARLALAQTAAQGLEGPHVVALHHAADRTCDALRALRGELDARRVELIGHREEIRQELEATGPVAGTLLDRRA